MISLFCCIVPEVLQSCSGRVPVMFRSCSGYVVLGAIGITYFVVAFLWWCWCPDLMCSCDEAVMLYCVFSLFAWGCFCIFFFAVLGVVFRPCSSHDLFGIGGITLVLLHSFEMFRLCVGHISCQQTRVICLICCIIPEVLRPCSGRVPVMFRWRSAYVVLGTVGLTLFAIALLP